MRIQHNIMAMNAYRNYTGNTSALSKNLEKLSSGYKINRAGDDAAGLAISEKMRAQITGLNKAQDNAKDGISLVQTAEGALTEVHDMLNRMYEIAEQSANGTYEDATDREQLQKEVTQLKDEINRIADSSNFNGIKLLDGSLADAKIDVSAIDLGGATAATTVDATAATSKFTAAQATNTTTEQTLTVEYLDANGKSNKVDIKYKGGADQAKTAEAIKSALAANGDISSVFDVTAAANGDITFTSKVTGANGAKVISVASTDTAQTTNTITAVAGANAYVSATNGANANMTAGESVTINGKTYEFVDDASKKPTKDGAIAVQIGKDVDASVANLNKALEGTGITVTKNTNDLKFTSDKNGAGLTLQIGDTSEDFNQLNVTVKDCHTTAIGIDGVNIGNQAGAAAALDTIKAAINYVSDVRGTLGATQNRLDHTINNLSVMEENIQDAESTIRDTDVADEMMAYTKNNILIQS
ncbi:MAG: flagellin, partial [Clostridiales bacterium]|nr:flagellin [Clostridiales bacterium]